MMTKISADAQAVRSYLTGREDERQRAREREAAQRSSWAERERRDAMAAYRRAMRRTRRRARRVRLCAGGLLVLTVLAALGVYAWR